MKLMHRPLILCLLLSSTMASARTAADVSWAKAGVSLEQFARDSNECAEASRYAAAYIKPNTLVALDALSSSQLIEMAEDLGSGGPGALQSPIAVVSGITSSKSADDIARRTFNFGEKYSQMVSNDVRDQLQAALDQCLSGRGYVQIQLTNEQRKNLSRLKHSSPERTAYLHAIDSDLSVIYKQKIKSDY